MKCWIVPIKKRDLYPKFSIQPHEDNMVAKVAKQEVDPETK